MAARLSARAFTRSPILRGTLQTPLSMRCFSSYIITPEQLSEAIKQSSSGPELTKSKIVPVCASWFLPNDPQGRTGQQVYQEARIPCSKFFDLDEIKDHDSVYPHMLPTAEDFADAMRAIGINKEDTIVVYDSKELGLFSAPRAGWTFKVFGHPKVHVLNNFKLWVERGHPIESGKPGHETEQTSKYPTPSVNPEMVVKFAEIKAMATDVGQGRSEDTQILDARSQGRWAGRDPEPRPGLPSGHIPGSVSVPLTELLHPETKTLLPGEALRKIFESKGLDPKKPIVSSCGTGVTAAVIDAALAEAAFGKADDRRLYDGSWTEWAQRVTDQDAFIKKI